MHCIAGKATTSADEEVAADTADQADAQERTTAAEDTSVGPGGSPHPAAQPGNMEHSDKSSNPFQLRYLHTCIAQSAHVHVCTLHTADPFLCVFNQLVLHLPHWQNLTCPKQPPPVNQYVSPIQPSPVQSSPVQSSPVQSTLGAKSTCQSLLPKSHEKLVGNACYK